MHRVESRGGRHEGDVVVVGGLLYAGKVHFADHGGLLALSNCLWVELNPATLTCWDTTGFEALVCIAG